MANIILKHTIKAVFSKHVSFAESYAYITDYMPEDLLSYIELIVKKEYPNSQVKNENVEWDLDSTSRVNIGLTGVDGKLGTFVLTFDFPSGKPRKPSFEEAE